MESSYILPYAGREAAIRNMGGSVSAYNRYLDRFRTAYRDSVHEITSMMDNDSSDEARILAHSVKGLAATLGLTRLTAAAADLENAIKNGQPIEEHISYYGICLSEILNE